MDRYMCTHTFPAGSFTHDKVCQVAEASQHENQVRGYRSFFNLSGGKAWCIIEATDRKAVVTWFQKMGIPYDTIEIVELEGNRGMMEDLRRQPAMSGATA